MKTIQKKKQSKGYGRQLDDKQKLPKVKASEIKRKKKEKEYD